MSIKYTHILETVEDDGVHVPSYYGKYLAYSYEDALQRAEKTGFLGGIRVDGVEKADLFSNKEEFELHMKDKAFPVAIVPLV